VIAPIVSELSIISQAKFANVDQLIDAQRRRLLLPSNERDCAAYHLRLLEVFVHPDVQLPHYSMVFGKGSNRLQDASDDFFARTLSPLCSYIDELIDDGDLLLYTLSRYQRECTWFEAGSLAELAQAADSRKLEEVLDAHLRSWLFREGVDYPFSTPKSPSGRADLVVWHGEEPLPIEVKVFDDKDRDQGHVAQGLWQAQRYASDYGRPFGYLVVFNTSAAMLSFEGDIATDGPPCIVVGGLNVFVVSINFAANRPSASKEKPLETKVVKMPAAPALT